jgi:hypothetical protein
MIRVRMSRDDNEGATNLHQLMIKLTDALRYHLLPYLEETGLSGIDPVNPDLLSPKVYLLFRFVELTNAILQTDIRLKMAGVILPNPQHSDLVAETFLRKELVQYLVALF